MHNKSHYDAAQETLNDMARIEPGDPFAGHRAVLKGAVRVPQPLRKAAIHARLSEALRAAYYANGVLWDVYPGYRAALVNLADALCEDIVRCDEVMEWAAREMAARGRGEKCLA
jgi:hypothetical protein